MITMNMSTGQRKRKKDSKRHEFVFPIPKKELPQINSI